MTTDQIASAYNLINPAKLSKMEDADKFKVIKGIRVLKPISESFEAFIKDARERLKDEDYPSMEERANQWNKKYKDAKLRSEIPAEEIKELEEINAYLKEYNDKVNECIQEEADKEHEITFEKLNEDAFVKFIASNDFDVKTIVELQDTLTQA